MFPTTTSTVPLNTPCLNKNTNQRRNTKKHLPKFDQTSPVPANKMLSSGRVMFAVMAVAFLIVLFDQPAGTEAGYGKGHGHGHGHGASGTACIVKGSYCSCHYCKCEKGHIHCGKHGGYGKIY